MHYVFSTLNQYFCRVFLFYLGSCTLIIGTLISLLEGTELVRRSMGKTNINFSSILEMIFLKLPNHFQMLLPFIILASTMAMLYRLNHSHEIIAARSAGLSVWQLIKGLSGFILVIGLFQLIILNPLSAAMNSRLQNLEMLYFSGTTNSLSISETGLWLKEVTPERQSIIHTTLVEPDSKTFIKVTFHNFDSHGIYNTRIDAEMGILEKGYWLLKDAVIWENKKDATKVYETIKLSTALTFEKIQNSSMSPETISFWSLPKAIKNLEKSGLSSLNYRLYWHGQISKIGMMLAMILLATAFGIRPVRQGKTALYITFGICSGFALHFLNDIVYALGLGGQIPVILAAWAPTFIMVFLSLALLLHNEDG